MIHDAQHPATRRRTLTLWAALTLLCLMPAHLMANATLPLPSSTPEAVGISSERLQRVDDVLQKFVADGRASGIVTLISRHGQTVHSSAIGTMGINDPRPMAMDSLFRIMSMTKLVTAIAALQLYEEGQFHLYDPVAKYIPAFADMHIYQEGKLVPATQTMTVHQLFTHTAGLSYGYPDDHPVHKLLDAPVNTDPVRDGLDYATRIAALPLQYEPGSAWHYSFASDVLGALVEVVSGQSLADYFAEHIFSPLGMADTSYVVSAEKITRLTTAHQWDSQAAQLQELSGPPFNAPYRYLPVDGGGAGLVSTAGDYLRLLEMLRQGGSLDGQRILGPKTVQFMTLDHLPRSLTDANVGENLNLTLGRGGSHGLGIGIYLDPVRRGVLSSPGELEWGGAYQTIYWWDPVEDILLVSMLQLGGSPWSLQYRDDLAVAVYQALTTLQP